MSTFTDLAAFHEKRGRNLGVFTHLAVWAKNGVVNSTLAHHALSHEDAVTLSKPLGVGEWKFIVSIHQGGLGVDEFKRLTNIKPNAIDGLRIHRPAEFKQCWEKLLTKVKFFTDRNVLKHFGFKNVQTGVDDIAEGFFGTWFF